MKQLYRSVDSLIRSAKKRDALKDVVFVRSFSSKHMDHPVGRFLAVVDPKDVREERFVSDRTRALLSLSLEIRLYAPREADGSSLFELCAELIDALLKSADRLIEDTAVSEICYDSSMRSVYRRVSLTVRTIEEVGA